MEFRFSWIYASPFNFSEVTFVLFSILIGPTVVTFCIDESNCQDFVTLGIVCKKPVRFTWMVSSILIIPDMDVEFTGMVELVCGIMSLEVELGSVELDDVDVELLIIT